MINQEIYEKIKDELLNIDVRWNEPDSFIKEFRFPNKLTSEELDDIIFRLRSWREDITYPEKIFASLYLNSMILALSKEPSDVELYLVGFQRLHSRVEMWQLLQDLIIILMH